MMKLYKALTRLFTTDASFHQAIKEGRINSVAEIIDLGINLNNYCATRTPLQCSLLYKQSECTVLLLEKGADANLCLETWYSTDKTLQFYMEHGHGGKSDAKILALYGANLADPTYFTVNEDVQEFQKLILEKLEDYNKIKELEQSLQASTTIINKIRIYTQLSRLWSKQCENEECVVYRNHYQKKAKNYYLKVQQLNQENKSMESRYSSIFFEEKVSIPLLNQPVARMTGTKLKID